MCVSVCPSLLSQRVLTRSVSNTCTYEALPPPRPAVTQECNLHALLLSLLAWAPANYHFHPGPTRDNPLLGWPPWAIKPLPTAQPPKHVKPSLRAHWPSVTLTLYITCCQTSNSNLNSPGTTCYMYCNNHNDAGHETARC